MGLTDHLLTGMILQVVGGSNPRKKNMNVKFGYHLPQGYRGENKKLVGGSNPFENISQIGSFP